MRPLRKYCGGAHSNFCTNATTHDGLIRQQVKFAIRLVDADYELTRFGNDFTKGNNNQSDFRFQTGLRFRF